MKPAPPRKRRAAGLGSGAADRRKAQQLDNTRIRPRSAYSEAGAPSPQSPGGECCMDLREAIRARVRADEIRFDLSEVVSEARRDEMLVERLECLRRWHQTVARVRKG